MIAVDLFAGWGGFTLAAESLGIHVAWAGNHWPLAVDTHALNHTRTHHVCQDLRQADWFQLPRYDLLIASPACQGHSSASQPKRRAYHDAMRATAWSVIDCADATSPRAVIVENVPAFRHWKLFPIWREALVRLGYHVEEHLVTASRHGVPQRRVRLFITATKKRARFDFAGTPHETPFGPSLETEGPWSWRPVAKATPDVRDRIARGRKNHGRRFLSQHVTNHPGVGLDEPIRTITTIQDHWVLVDGDRYRSLTMRELARGMGFPETYRWPDTATRKEITMGLGNAVAPPAGAAVIRQVMGVV